MDLSPYQRLELFWQSKGLKNASAFADSVDGLTAAALSAIKQRRSTPSASLMRNIQRAYPELNPDYILWGTGSALKDGRTLTPVTNAAEEPSAAYGAVVANPDVVTAFLGQMAEMARNHRDEVQTLKKEARKDLRAQAEHYDYTIRRISEDFVIERAELKARIFDLELRAGLRQPTAAELELMEKQAAPRAKKPGFKNYDEEQPVSEEAVMTVSHSNPDFIRPLPLEKEVSHLQAA